MEETSLDLSKSSQNRPTCNAACVHREAAELGERKRTPERAHSHGTLGSLHKTRSRTLHTNRDLNH